MTIRYKCAECGAVLNIKDELAGTAGNCPRCQVEFIVPAPESAPVAEAPSAVPAPAAAATQKSDEPKPAGPGGALSEDDIEQILAGGGSSPAPASSRVALAGNGEDEEEDEEADERRRRKKKKSRRPADDELDDEEDDEEDEDDDDEEEDDEDDEEELRRRRKKKKLAGKSGPKKGDSSESAAIARGLMARGEKPREGEKRSGRPFGGKDRPEQEEGFTTKEVVAQMARQGWPYVAAALFLIAVISYALYTPVKTPPLAYVTGTVTLDGKPLPGAIVEFQPVRENFKDATMLSTSFGFTDDKGKYVLIYLNDIPGAVIGNHTVRIKKADEEKGELLAPKYNTRSELKAEVKKGAPPYDFALEAVAGGSSEPVAGGIQQ